MIKKIKGNHIISLVILISVYAWFQLNTPEKTINTALSLKKENNQDILFDVRTKEIKIEEFVYSNEY